MNVPPVAPALEVEGLVSGYGGAMVLRGVSLRLAPGEIVAVLGKNGMGKSTLLKTVMGFLPAREGRVRLGGEDVTGRAPHLVARAGVAHAPQEFTIFQDLTVAENLRLGVSSDADYRARLGALEGVFPRMLERLRQRAGTLSGGEQKMLLMSRALLARPRVMLVDEISEGLQPTMIDRMAEALRAAREGHGVAILLVEQHLAFALSVADRYAVLKLGEIIEEGAAGDPAAAGALADHLKV
ncbi:ABC transporter ATP-binding protein [Rubrimonas cliftonensis]|uniref:Amino acid/amide ABC transporter ATP-binding protein 2, HAAT family n=1 Tax=Rubrimonas cliftonensis TaxID=89524 RepID=A0A1H4D9H2_9RHOB|nr:ABC transporter ATP-binding protein [Rubrimonas cliftonensis]SEA69198.1 amino acid/amide ABC transporter ATP-binding protein 2, HAAT family [Rubrimonas cliftonensis]